MWYNTSRDCRKKRDKWKGVLICRSVKNAGQSSGLCITQIYGEYVNQYIKKQGQIPSSRKYKGKKDKAVPVDATEMCTGSGGLPPLPRNLHTRYG